MSKPLTVTISLTALPPQAGEPPAEIRLRQALKLLLRAFRFKAEWAPAPGQPTDCPTLDCFDATTPNADAGRNIQHQTAGKTSKAK